MSYVKERVIAATLLAQQAKHSNCKWDEVETAETGERSFYRFIRLLAFWLAASMRDTLRIACGERGRQTKGRRNANKNPGDRTTGAPPLLFTFRLALLQWLIKYSLPEAGCASLHCEHYNPSRVNKTTNYLFQHYNNKKPVLLSSLSLLK